MSADACLAFYGIRFEIASDEIEGLETRSDPRLIAARRTGLKTYWGNFGGIGERYLLFVGANLAVLGPENQSDVAFGLSEFQAIVDSTKARLLSAGLAGEPSLYIQWQQDS